MREKSAQGRKNLFWVLLLCVLALLAVKGASDVVNAFHGGMDCPAMWGESVALDGGDYAADYRSQKVDYDLPENHGCVLSGLYRIDGDGGTQFRFRLTHTRSFLQDDLRSSIDFRLLAPDGTDLTDRISIYFETVKGIDCAQFVIALTKADLTAYADGDLRVEINFFAPDSNRTGIVAFCQMLISVQSAE